MESSAEILPLAFSGGGIGVRKLLCSLECLSDPSGYLLLLQRWCAVVTHCAILGSRDVALN